MIFRVNTGYNLPDLVNGLRLTVAPTPVHRPAGLHVVTSRVYTPTPR